MQNLKFMTKLVVNKKTTIPGRNINHLPSFRFKVRFMLKLRNDEILKIAEESH